MAEKFKINTDGDLELIKSEDVIISTLSRKDVVGKKAEAQTIVDHLVIDLAVAQDKVNEWDDYLTEIDK